MTKKDYRWGKCDKCGEPLDMHYVKWCPYCSKPSDLVHDGIIDVLMMLMWCDVRIEGLQKRIWDDMCDNESFINDTIKRNTIDRYCKDKENNSDKQFIYDNFNGLGIKLFEFTW